MDQHLGPRQYRSQRAAQPPFTIAQFTSPLLGETHHAAVRLPPPDPFETQRIVGPSTRICPCELVPVGRPTSRTSASLASKGSAEGQGCPSLQVPSNSRAAIPERRTRGPSAHQTGPSPSHTWVGVQAKVCPDGTTGTLASRSAKNMGAIYTRDGIVLAIPYLAESFSIRSSGLNEQQAP